MLHDLLSSCGYGPEWLLPLDPVSGAHNRLGTIEVEVKVRGDGGASFVKSRHTLQKPGAE